MARKVHSDRKDHTDREEEGEEGTGLHQEAMQGPEVGMAHPEVVTVLEEECEAAHHLQDGMAEVEEATDHHLEQWRWVICVARRPDLHLLAM